MLEKSPTITAHFVFVFEEKSAWESHDCRSHIVSEKLRIQDVFRSHQKEKTAFSISSGLKSVFEELRFRDG